MTSRKKNTNTILVDNDFVETKDYLLSGLTENEVKIKTELGQLNGEQTVRTKSVLQILCGKIFTFFNFLFVAMAIILSFFGDNIADFGFLILVVINAVIGIVQELRAKKTMDKLSLLSAPKTKVIRNGEQKEVTVKDILLDDLTILATGDQICADSVISEGKIEVNESMITGEPDAITKNIGDHVMSGSCVISGKAKARVEHIGSANFVMKISSGAKYLKKPNSEIWRSLMLIVKIMACVIIPLGIGLVYVKHFAQGVEWNSTVVGTIGSLVGMIPNGLVALSSTVFCISVIRLGKHKTLAQDMYCVETLARVDVLCLDKTGTITNGEMEVNGLDMRKGLKEENFKEILRTILSATKDENATAIAIRKYISDKVSSSEVTVSIPFSSIRKWSGAYFNKKSYVLGAPEFILPEDKDLLQKCDEYACQGYRVLAVASSTQKFKENALPEKLKPEGLVILTDTIRREAPDTLRFFAKQGVTIKIISGDNPVTVRAVAIRAGLQNCEDIIDMSTLAPDADLSEICERYTIFGRVRPEQKLALVKALKGKKHTVAMTGDGVNDVLALKESDCSVAMASGSDASKNVSSLVLLDNNFASLPKVVAEGRRSINNLERSASLFLVKTIYNFLLAVLFLFVPQELPFEPSQLTLIGMVTIGVPSFILALEPNGERVKGRFLPKVLCNALPGAVMVTVGIGLVLLANQMFLPALTKQQVQIMYVLVTTFVGFIYLIKVCIPFNFVHIVLCAGMIALFVFCLFIRINLPSLGFVDYQPFNLTLVITEEMGLCLGTISLIVTPWFIIMLRLADGLQKVINGGLDKRKQYARQQ